MTQKLVDYLMAKPRYIIWRILLAALLCFWLLVVFGIAFLFHYLTKCGQKSRDFLTALF